MKEESQALGAWGEDFAAHLLASQGYVIRCRNFRTPQGEIDLIAEKEGVLVFFEVKTRSDHQYLNPETSVGVRKQMRLLRAAEKYLQENPECPSTWQFDVLAIIRRKEQPPEVIHFENVIT